MLQLSDKSGPTMIFTVQIEFIAIFGNSLKIMMRPHLHSYLIMEMLEKSRKLSEKLGVGLMIASTCE